MLAVRQLRQQCVPPGSAARSHCGSMHRWSRLALARSGGTGYSMQTIGQGRWTGHQGTQLCPRVPFRCAAGRCTLSTCNGSAGKAILQARLFAQPLASSTYRIRYGCPLRSCIAFLFRHLVSMSQMKILSPLDEHSGTCAQKSKVKN